MLRYCWVVWSSYQDQTSSSRDYYGVSGTFSSRANITNQRALETVFDCFVPHVGLDVLIHPAIRLFLGRRLAQHVFSSFREGSFASCGVQK